MPQSDNITLFSQVFWLVFLYLFFSSVVSNFYLPNFSKLFNLRFHYMSSSNYGSTSSNAFSSNNMPSVFFNFNSIIQDIVSNNLTSHSDVVNDYNLTLLGGVNNYYILSYTRACVKSNLHKNLYL